MKPLIITICLCCLACNALAQSLRGDHMDEYELAVPATFAITLSQAKPLGDEPAQDGAQTMTLTSGNIGRFYGLPKDARCYWIFDFDAGAPLIAGALVMASKETGEIYEEFAYGFGTTLFDLIEGGPADAQGVGVSLREHGRISITINMAINWVIDPDVEPIVTFGRFGLDLDEAHEGSRVSFSSVTDLAGDGLEGSAIIVTKGCLQAKGEVHKINR